MASLLKPQPFRFKQHPSFSVPRRSKIPRSTRSQRVFHCHPLLSPSNSCGNHASSIAGILKKRSWKWALAETPEVASKLLIASVNSRCTSAKPPQITSEEPSSVDFDTFPTIFAENPMLSEVDADFLLPRSSIVDRYRSKVTLAPRICTLREFRKFGEEIVAVESDEKLSDFFKSLAANIEFSAKIQDWEILSGRLAMIVFVSAVLLEALTGNSVFQKLDPQRLLEVFAAVVISILGAAGFALAWQAKGRIPYTMSKGYEYLINAMIDNVIDDLLFDDEVP